MKFGIDFFGHNRRNNPKPAEYVDSNGNPISRRQYLTGDLTDTINNLVNGVGNVINTGSAAATETQWQREQQAVQDQRDWEMKVWNMNNEYNSPSAQMERYAEAGLNPNLIYGSGSAAAGNSSSAPDASKANAPTNQIASAQGVLNLLAVPMSILNQYQDYQMKKLQIDNAAESLAMKRAENDYWLRRGKYEANPVFLSYGGIFDDPLEYKLSNGLELLGANAKKAGYNNIYLSTTPYAQRGKFILSLLRGEEPDKRNPFYYEWRKIKNYADLSDWQVAIERHRHRLISQQFTDLANHLWNSGDKLISGLLAHVPSYAKLLKFAK